jgi:hypothetical protein
MPPAVGEWRVGEILLYGLDDAGETAFTAQLREADRDRLRDIAREHLNRHAAVEVWDGPLCVVRLRRTPHPS